MERMEEAVAVPPEPLDPCLDAGFYDWPVARSGYRPMLPNTAEVRVFHIFLVVAFFLKPSLIEFFFSSNNLSTQF